MFLNLWNYLRGYVIIEVSGFCVERFINLAVYKGIRVWDAQPTPSGIAMKISVGDFKRLIECRRKTKCRIKIKKRFGLPFAIHKNRKRKFFAVGVLLFMLLVYILSSFIWLIEIEGNERISSSEILEFCEENGLKIGALKSKTDKAALTAALKNNFSELSWVAISIRGTRAVIKLTETIPPLSPPNSSEPCDIIADSDAVIVSIVASAGTPLVKAQDVVGRGDVLVSAELVAKENEAVLLKKYVHAKADIKARQWHNIKISIPIKYTAKNYTGNTVKRYEGSLFNKKISFNLLKNNISYENYDKITRSRQLSAGKNFPLPFIMIVNEYREYIPESKSLPIEQAKTAAEKQIVKKILSDFDANAEIENKQYKFTQNNNELILDALITVVRDFGVEQKPAFDGETEAVSE